MWTIGSKRKEVCGNHEKFSGEEGETERGMRLLGAYGSPDLGWVGSTMLGLWLGNRKVGSQVVGKD